MSNQEEKKTKVSTKVSLKNEKSKKVEVCSVENNKTQSAKQMKIKQVKSSIGVIQAHKDTLRSLNLGKIGRTSVFVVTDSFLGRVNTVKHLLEIENC